MQAASEPCRPDSFLFDEKNTHLKQQKNARVPERINNAEFLILKQISPNSKIIVFHLIKKEEKKNNNPAIQKEFWCSSKKHKVKQQTARTTAVSGPKMSLSEWKAKLWALKTAAHSCSTSSSF